MLSFEELVKLEKSLKKLEGLHLSFDYLKITIASPERIQIWADRVLPSGEIIGEVLTPETINFRTHLPEVNGLFCEKIFGPLKNWSCQCGKYQGGLVARICETCEVEVTDARMRRYRMGYINLNYPVVHLWYLKGNPSYLTLIFRHFVSPFLVTNLWLPEEFSKLTLKEKEQDITPENFEGYFSSFEEFEDYISFQRRVARRKKKYPPEEITLLKLEKIIYFKKTRETEPNDSLYPFLYKEKKKSKKFSLNNFFLSSSFSIHDMFENKKERTGAELLQYALNQIDLKQAIHQTRFSLAENSLRGAKVEKTSIRRIQIFESFLATKTKLSWMILTKLPVLPPTLRPLIEIENGKLVVSDLNEMYRLIFARNENLLGLMAQTGMENLIINHSCKLLQESVDTLIDNARLPQEKQFMINNQPLKSLTEILQGKFGRFRYNLLGKRVDYSGRSVIIVGPTLRLNQCGLPYEMVRDLFQPFLIHELVVTIMKAPSENLRLASLIITKNKPFLFSLLEKLTDKYSILLNRAPTLHRFGIQAFDPFIVLGQAIHLHPLVCTGFNADFDGDQMAVHLPLYELTQLEARTMMRPSSHVLSPSDGSVIVKPTQDMVIGSYYLTLMIKKRKKILTKWFSSETEVLSSFYQKKIEIHSSILIRYRLPSFQITLHKNQLIFHDTNSFLEFNTKQIFISKIFQIYNQKEKIEKYYFLTNLGIFIAHSLPSSFTFQKDNCEKFKNIEEKKELKIKKCEKKKYIFTDFFLETTPGRILFSLNFQNSMEEKTYVD